MFDKANLRDKRVAFKIEGIDRTFVGNVQYVENDGFWLQAPDLYAEVAKGTTWSGDLKKPVVFVPTARLNWLIASGEEQISRRRPIG
jgi:hypothetical protein